MIIYKITNTVNGKLYIGQTKQKLSKRWCVHKYCSRKSPLTSSFKKHGINKFVIEPLCSALTVSDLDYLERYFISYFNTIYPYGYNILPGGDVSHNIREPWNKGKKETRKAVLEKLKMSHIGQTAWNKGIPLREDVKYKLSLQKKGKHVSRATEFKSGQPSIFKGKRHSVKSRKLIAMNNAKSLKIICNELNVIYNSIAEASRKLSINKKQIKFSLIKGTVHKRTGYSFRYI